MRLRPATEFRVAHASRVLVIASARLRTFLQPRHHESMFRRDVATNTRGPSRTGVACATQSNFYRGLRDPVYIQRKSAHFLITAVLGMLLIGIIMLFSTSAFDRYVSAD